MLTVGLVQFEKILKVAHYAGSKHAIHTLGAGNDRLRMFTVNTFNDICRSVSEA